MNPKEIRALVQAVAAADPRDRATQISLLERINAMRELMRLSEQEDLAAYLEAAGAATEVLAGSSITHDKLSAIASRFVKKVEQRFESADADATPGIVTAGPIDPDAGLDPDQCLGDVLVTMGAVTPEQVEEGLRAQRATGVRIGEALVMLGHVGWDQVKSAVSLQDKMRASVELQVRPGSLRLSD